MPDAAAAGGGKPARHATLGVASLTLKLGDMQLKLPNLLKTRQPITWDPWDPADPDAPRGMRSRKWRAAQHANQPLQQQPAELPAAQSHTAANGRSQQPQQQQALPLRGDITATQAAAPSTATAAAAMAVAQPSLSQSPQQQAGQQPSPSQQLSPSQQQPEARRQDGQQNDGPLQGQPRRRKAAHGDGKPRNPFGAWVAEHMPKLPSGPELRNSLPLWLVLSPAGAPDKRRLMTVQDFFKYTEDEGMGFFRELDRNGDGRISTDDVKAALRVRNLPDRLANNFIRSARGGRWWDSSVGWEDFKAVVEEREPQMLRAFTSMEVDASGQLKSEQIQSTLRRLGVPATEENAKAMIRTLGGEEDGAVSYSRFRRFAILLPPERLSVVDPGLAWFEAATVMPLSSPRVAKAERGPNYLAVLAKAALAGGLASSVSVLALHPIDTLKTRVQSTPGATIRGIAATAPSIGARGLYRGIIPAVGGSFVSHGMRTLSYEAAAAGLGRLLGGAAELQVQGLASGVGTVLGTCIRIPCEVLKQRLQVGRHANCVEAARAAMAADGASGLFRGTAALLSREVPFYVIGMVGYQQFKKLANGSAWGDRPRELAPWQMIALGGLAAACASVLTMPADVLKTRIMSAAAGSSRPAAGALLKSIVQKEGIGALYRGALPRALWVAPVGAMNFAGYELAKRALAGQPDAAAVEADGGDGGGGDDSAGGEQPRNQAQHEQLAVA